MLTYVPTHLWQSELQMDPLKHHGLYVYHTALHTWLCEASVILNLSGMVFVIYDNMARILPIVGMMDVKCHGCIAVS